jgi:hypothetical protein
LVEDAAPKQGGVLRMVLPPPKIRHGEAAGAVLVVEDVAPKQGGVLD